MKTSLSEGDGVLFSDKNERFTDAGYADDIAVTEESEERMQSLLNKIDRTGRKIGLCISPIKTKIMSCCIAVAPRIYLGYIRLENVQSFGYLGSKISSTGGIDCEIERRIAKAKTLCAS